MKNWLENLKVGDRVFESQPYGHYYGAELPVKIERLTSTQIITSRGKFRRDTGLSIGSSSYSRTRLLEATPELELNFKKAMAIRRIEKIAWSTLHPEQLFAIIEILNQK